MDDFAAILILGLFLFLFFRNLWNGNNKDGGDRYGLGFDGGWDSDNGGGDGDGSGDGGGGGE